MSAAAPRARRPHGLSLSMRLASAFLTCQRQACAGIAIMGLGPLFSPPLRLRSAFSSTTPIKTCPFHAFSITCTVVTITHRTPQCQPHHCRVLAAHCSPPGNQLSSTVKPALLSTMPFKSFDAQCRCSTCPEQRCPCRHAYDVFLSSSCRLRPGAHPIQLCTPSRPLWLLCVCAPALLSLLASLPFLPLAVPRIHPCAFWVL